MVCSCEEGALDGVRQSKTATLERKNNYETENTHRPDRGWIVDGRRDNDFVRAKRTWSEWPRLWRPPTIPGGTRSSTGRVPRKERRRLPQRRPTGVGPGPRDETGPRQRLWLGTWHARRHWTAQREWHLPDEQSSATAEIEDTRRAMIRVAKTRHPNSLLIFAARIISTGHLSVILRACRFQLFGQSIASAGQFVLAAQRK